jgi:hypothetical protein
MHQSMGLLTRSMFVSPFVALGALALVGVACVDPQQDYNDYVDRTADAHAPPPLPTFDAGETGPLYAPDAGFSANTFLLSCLTTQAAGDPSKASLAVAHVTYTPNGNGMGGTLQFGDQALLIGATSLADAAQDAKYTTGSTAMIAADGTGTVTFGDTQIPEDANPVTTSALEFSSSSLTFHVESETQICAIFNATVIKPAADVVKDAPCIVRYLPSASTPLPALQLSDFHCP